MTASHGRAGRSGGMWLATSLTASGLFLAVSGGRPALACHIAHRSSTTTTSTTTHPSTAAATPTTAPKPAVQDGLQTFLKAWNDRPMSPIIPTPTPTATSSGVKAPAAQVLTPPPATSTTVQDWHKTAPPTCATPPPPCTSGPSATPGATSAPLHAPASFLPAPTPAPEPSTILSAFALAGAFAWHRRSTRA